MASVSILFVCMGNICRSPMAEALLRELVRARGLDNLVEIDSAGTHSYHVGSPPHDSTCERLRLHGIPVGDQRSRLVVSADLERFDYVVVMDRENLAGVEALRTAASSAEVSLMLEHAPSDELRALQDVPDPWMVGGYDRVYDLLNEACAGLLEHVCAREPALAAASRD